MQPLLATQNLKGKLYSRRHVRARERKAHGRAQGPQVQSSLVYTPICKESKQFPGRKRQPSDDARTASITSGSKSKSTARGTYLLAARGLVVEHVDDAMMRVAVAKVLAAAANVVVVALNLLKLGAHLTTALARTPHVRNSVW
jgi:hypothetical protein